MVHVAKVEPVDILKQRHILDVAPVTLGAIGKDALYLIDIGACSLKVLNGVEPVGDARNQAIGSVAGLVGLVGERSQVAGIDSDLANTGIVI